MQYFSGLIQSRLHYVLISHNYPEVVKNSETLGAMSTGHPALCSFQHISSDLCKFNSSLDLSSNESFIEKVSKQIQRI